MTTIGRPIRVVAIGDLHCGHAVGLTPPKFNPKSDSDYRGHDAREEYWNFYAKTIDALKPIDVLIVNADCIDGKGEGSGGTELITSDRNVQVDMAVAAIQHADAGSIFMSFGTNYHTGREEDWEKQIADEVGAIKIESHGWIDLRGCIVDYKHHIGGSQSPVGRYTALSRERVWNVLWAERGENEKSNIILRSHVHYHVFSGERGWVAMTLPALQGYGSKFGARRMSGTVDYGLVSFDIVGKDNWTWHSHILRPKVGKSLAYKVEEASWWKQAFRPS